MKDIIQSNSKVTHKNGVKSDHAGGKHKGVKDGINAPSQQTIVQPKLELTTPGDSYEREADRMADFVMRKAYSGLPTEMPSTSSILPPMISRRASSSTSGVAVDKATESGIHASRGGGQPMPTALRSQMESGFEADFSGVRLHTGSAAEAMSNDLSAKAFTYGNDIYFNRGQYSPDTTAGQHLIAHELTHVVQQSGKVGREEVDPKCSFSILDVNEKEPSQVEKGCGRQLIDCKSLVGRIQSNINSIELELNKIFEKIDIEESDETPAWSGVCSILALLAAAATFGTSTAIAGTLALASATSSIGKEYYQQTINDNNKESKTAKERIKEAYGNFFTKIKGEIFTENRTELRCDTETIQEGKGKLGQINTNTYKLNVDIINNREKYKGIILKSIIDYKKYVTPVNKTEIIAPVGKYSPSEKKETYTAEINGKIYLIETTTIYENMGFTVNTYHNSIELIPDNMLDFAKEKAGNRIRGDLAFARSIKSGQQSMILSFYEYLTPQYMSSDINIKQYDLVEKNSLLSDDLFKTILLSLRNLAITYFRWRYSCKALHPILSDPENKAYRNHVKSFLSKKRSLNDKQIDRLNNILEYYNLNEMDRIVISMSDKFENSCEQLIKEGPMQFLHISEPFIIEARSSPNLLYSFSPNEPSM